MKIKEEIARFLMVTPIVALIDLGFYFLFKIFTPSYIAKGISYFCGSTAGYFLNKNWTFRQHRKSHAEIARYWIGQIVLLGYNVLANGTVLFFWPRAYVPAVAVASLSTAVLSFISKKWWVFKVPCPPKGVSQCVPVLKK